MGEIEEKGPLPTPSPKRSARSASSSVAGGAKSQVVDVEWREVTGAEAQKEPAPAPAPIVAVPVARAAEASGRRGRRAKLARSPAHAPCVTCGRPSAGSARVFGVAYVPLCRRCGAIGTLALRLLGGV